MHGSGISIWFFIGVLLSIYGVLIFAYGIYEFVSGVHADVALWQLHAPIWWGAIMGVLGGLYCFKFKPTKA
jgi:hypothetical protein